MSRCLATIDCAPNQLSLILLLQCITIQLTVSGSISYILSSSSRASFPSSSFHRVKRVLELSAQLRRSRYPECDSSEGDFLTAGRPFCIAHSVSDSTGLQKPKVAFLDWFHTTAD
ncbi:hypothetical protein EDD36DRAFT_160323 [Exophiala viscosa]|uniref:Uncharacterized protein n=1 Tax=Exophiala viscosa TaxID=2486360 RepID=A0AAN6E4M7_9EURO|nr:hypothetical protein EDD36DRAFT_160323 [Exophiala viscosa]